MANYRRPKTPSLNGNDSTAGFPKPFQGRFTLNTPSVKNVGEKVEKKRKDKKTLKLQFARMNRRRARRRKRRVRDQLTPPTTSSDSSRDGANDYRPKTPSIGDPDDDPALAFQIPRGERFAQPLCNLEEVDSGHVSSSMVELEFCSAAEVCAVEMQSARNQ